MLARVMKPAGLTEHSVQLEEFQRKHRTGLLTLLFTDIVGSGKIKQTLGDSAGVALIQQHHAIVREILGHFTEAQVIDTAGDSFFILFGRPSEAVLFALRLQARLRALASHSAHPLLERIGIHIGEVIVEEGDGASKRLFGAQVDTCARIMSLASGGQTLLSRAAFDNARQALKGNEIEGLEELTWLNHGPYLVKGMEESVEICEVGESGSACLSAPVNTDKAQRQVMPDAEPVLGWRPAIGQRVPNTQWTLEKKLGEGGFGEVWLGQHQVMKEHRVFKFCFKAERVRFLKREMTLFRLLKERVGDHPNIVGLREVNFNDPPFFVEMDYVEGSDLRTWCETQGGVEKIPLATRLEIVAQAADGLHAAHDAGVIHRDIKPTNILVQSSSRGHETHDRSGSNVQRSTSNFQRSTESPTLHPPRSTLEQISEPPDVGCYEVKAKLTDFGIGQVVSQEFLAGITRAGFTQTVMSDSSSSQTGTQLYMAPELLAGQPATSCSDIYSLGVVLYQLLVGDFRRPVTTDWANDISDPLLRDDLKHCFAGHPEDRFASAGELAKNLRSLPERRAALTQQQAVLLKREQIVRRWRLVRSAALAAVFVVLAFTVIRFYLRTAKVRWAREQALPQASQLADKEKFSEAFALALQAERYIPKDDPALTNLLGRVSVRVSIETVPPGADVYVMEYRAATTNWPYLGKSPVTGLRMAHGIYRCQIRKSGYAAPERAFWTGFPTNKFTLDKESAVPPGMVRVMGDETVGVTLWLTGLDHVESVKLGDYLMDKYEVSNRQFQDFVDGGGYLKTNYWKQPFINGGKALSWNEAMTLFRDRTGQPGPSTWANGKYPEGQENFPGTGVSWYEAAAYAEFAGKSLPTLFHWSRAASPVMASDMIPLSNFGAQGPAPAGAYRGMSYFGIYDMAGNAKEWCWNESELGNRYILGGSWLEPNYMFHVPDAQSPFERSQTYGFRCVKSLGSTPIPAAAANPVSVAFRDYSSEKPVADEIFQVFRSSFSYDKTDLNAAVELVDATSEYWRMEKVRFNAAYGNERVIAYLFLPKKSAPPYQTIIYFPTSRALYQRSSEARFLELQQIDFIVQSGRAVLYPVYKGTYERGASSRLIRPSPTTFYKDHVIAWSKDLGRGIDYLQTRKDINPEKLGYYGISWGGALGAILPAVEPRLKVSVLEAGGFWPQKTLPEVDQINFAPRVMIPTLMLNGRYDSVRPVESSQLPMFRLLGTPDQDKRHVIYETSHFIPRNELVKETLAWLDQYLDPVK